MLGLRKRFLLLPLSLLWGQTAHADEGVVVGEAQLAEVLQAALPLAVSGTLTEACAEAADITEALQRAEGSINYMELQAAAGALAEAEAALGCEAVDAAVAARIFYLLGVIQAAEGGSPTADFLAALQLSLIHI